MDVNINLQIEIDPSIAELLKILTAVEKKQSDGNPPSEKEVTVMDGEGFY